MPAADGRLLLTGWLPSQHRFDRRSEVRACMTKSKCHLVLLTDAMSSLQATTVFASWTGCIL